MITAPQQGGQPRATSLAVQSQPLGAARRAAQGTPGVGQQQNVQQQRAQLGPQAAGTYQQPQGFQQAAAYQQPQQQQGFQQAAAYQQPQGFQQASTYQQPQTTNYSASNNLIGSQINPTGSAAADQSQQAALAALQQLFGLTTGAQNPQIQWGMDQAQSTLQNALGVAGQGNTDAQSLLQQAMGSISQAGQVAGGGIPGAAQTGQQTAMDAILRAAGLSGTDVAGLSQSQDYMQQALSSMFNGPDRAQLAADALRLFEEQQADQRTAGIQDIGRGAAALGRIGSGVTTSQLGDLELQLTRERNQMEQSLANQAAQQTLADRQAQLGAATGTAGALSGLRTEELQQILSQVNPALASSQNAMGLQSEQIRQLLSQAGGALSGAQGASGLQNDQLQRLLAAAQGASGLSQSASGLAGDWISQGLAPIQTGMNMGQQFWNQAAQGRDELRGERDYQAGMDQQALQNYIQQMQLQEALTQGQFGRDQSRLNQQLQLAFGGSNIGDLLAAINGYGTGQQTDWTSIFGNLGNTIGQQGN